MAEALIAHCEWKDRLYLAISAREYLDRESIASDRVCAFGQWLHDEGRQKHDRQPLYHECVTAHAEFHGQTGLVVDALNAGRHDKASKMLAAGTAYAKAAQQLWRSVIAFHKSIDPAVK